jgi:hypothetical protein
MRRHGIRGTGEASTGSATGEAGAAPKPLSMITLIATLLLIFLSMAVGFAGPQATRGMIVRKNNTAGLFFNGSF